MKDEEKKKLDGKLVYSLLDDVVTVDDDVGSWRRRPPTTKPVTVQPMLDTVAGGHRDGDVGVGLMIRYELDRFSDWRDSMMVFCIVSMSDGPLSLIA